jgi:ribonuclease E
MTKKMLIDATHAEETRVAVVDGHKLVDFDYESKVRRQLKGSIFLAKVTRVEPSLQAAFVNFGGNRHGFLPFSEIHPDYFRIPIADREALLAEQADEMKALQAEEDAEEEAAAAAGTSDAASADDAASRETDDLEGEDEEEEDEVEEIGGEDVVAPLDEEESTEAAAPQTAETPSAPVSTDEFIPASYDDSDESAPSAAQDESAPDQHENPPEQAEGGRNGNENEARGDRWQRGRGRNRGRNGGRGRHGGRDRHAAAHSRRVEIVGGDGLEGDHPIRPTMRRHYKIQEVVKRGQIMLVQVSKEERGNKGAAVTTYLSLPGRYCVLMPNSTRAGGVSRKIANYQERSRMREILAELQVPEGMSVIMRTAGMSRTKTEIKRDLDYLMKLWDNIR